MDTEKNKRRILNIFLRGCGCYTCGPRSEEVIEKEYAGLDPITKEPIYEYYKYEWCSPFDDDLDYENVAETLDGNLVVNDGDYEETTREEYEQYLSYWHKHLSKNYIQEKEHERELRSEQQKLEIYPGRRLDYLRELVK